MPGFGGIQLERRIDLERLAKLVAALPLALRGAVDEGEMLVRARALLVAQPLAQRALEILGRLVVLARLVLLQRELERRGRAGRLDRREHRAPGGMPGLRRRELEAWIDGKHLAEFVPASALAPRRTVDEGEVLVRAHGFRIVQPQIDRSLQITSRIGVRALIVLAHAGLERRGAYTRFHQILPGLRAARSKQQKDGQRAQSHRKRCLILTASPGFISTCSTCDGKVELRISTVCAPGARSSVRSGGLTPRLLPSTSTSPHGATASSSRAAPAANGLSLFFVSFREGASGAALATAAGGGEKPGPAGACALRGIGGGASGSSSARAPTPPASSPKKTTAAATSAERRTPSGPERPNQAARVSPCIDSPTVSESRRLAGVPPTTEYTSCSRTCLSVRAPSWWKRLA